MVASPSASIQFRVAARTDIGLVRESNEDAVLVGDLDQLRLSTLVNGVAELDREGVRGPLLVVCDGMGGVAGGEVASDLAIRVLWREMSSSIGVVDPEVFARLLRRAVRIANAEIHAAGRRDVALRGMGTTLTAAAIAGSRLVVATVGDSRAYVLRGPHLVQVSRDQSLSSALAAAGHPIDEFENSGAILQALGVASDCEPSLSIIDLRCSDRILLCSDGLYNCVREDALAAMIADPRGPLQAAHVLIEAARYAGGHDNISAIVMQVDGERFLSLSGAADLPKFREFDPQREGDPALTSTSHVAKRLAARIGLAPDATELAIPVTGQHMVTRRTEVVSSPPRDLDTALAGQPSRGRVPWTWIAAVAVLALSLTALALR